MNTSSFAKNYMSVVGWSAESQVFAISDPQDLDKAGKETFVSLL